MDISAAFLAVLEAPRELVHDEAFNVGASSENYRIRDLAEIVEEIVPGRAHRSRPAAGRTSAPIRSIARRSPGCCRSSSPGGPCVAASSSCATPTPATASPSISSPAADTCGSTGSASSRRPADSMTSFAGACRSARADEAAAPIRAAGAVIFNPPGWGRLPDRRRAPRGRARIPRPHVLRASSPSTAGRCASCRAARSTARGNPARPALQAGAARGEAGPVHARLDPRDGRPAPRLADPPRVARRRAECAQRAARLRARGFAQGYQTLEDDTEVLYQMSHHYVPEAARGVWDDPASGSTGHPPIGA